MSTESAPPPLGDVTASMSRRPDCCGGGVVATAGAAPCPLPCPRPADIAVETTAEPTLMPMIVRSSGGISNSSASETPPKSRPKKTPEIKDRITIVHMVSWRFVRLTRPEPELMSNPKGPRPVLRPATAAPAMSTRADTAHARYTVALSAIFHPPSRDRLLTLSTRP
jgi:hypothetical protein